MEDLPKIVIPESYNYIGIFLTFSCNMKCSYCINKSDGLVHRPSMSTGDWLKGLNRIVTRDDLPITLSGGEPTVYKGFYDLIERIDKGTNIDLLTNGMFDIGEFKKRVPADRLRRKAPYASIRVSYHPEEHDIVELLHKVRYLASLGYSVGIWAVDYPPGSERVREVKRIAEQCYGIDFRLKEFLGVYQNRLYGSYAYPGAMNKDKVTSCLCKTSELIVGPSGEVFRCHRDMYHYENSIGHILDEDLQTRLDKWIECENYGRCNACDIKSKFDRFQVSGHCAVSIQEIGK